MSILSESHPPIYSIAEDKSLANTSLTKISNVFDLGTQQVLARTMAVYWRNDDEVASLWSKVDRGEISNPGGSSSTVRPSSTTSLLARTSQLTASLTTRSTTSNPAVESPSATLPLSSQTSTRKPRNMKIGIGIGIPVACVTFSVGVFAAVIMRRNRRRLRSKTRNETNETVELDGNRSPPEMEITTWE